MNIIENLNIREEYFVLAKKLSNRILVNNESLIPKLVIAIGGESGSGKSTTALCLEKELRKKGLNSISLHMDSYFKLPPKDNHQQRINSLEAVGPHEVDLDHMNQHISSFLNEEKTIVIPVVHYQENKFTSYELDLDNVEILIVEGVYSFLLDNVNVKIFLKRNYKDTFENRMKRTRENHEPMIESILEIEHNMVKGMINDADYVIEKNYSLL